MALINPVHTFIVPFLVVVVVPLAVFAGITTTLAFSVLGFRVVTVYLDIALSLMPQCFAASDSSTATAAAAAAAATTPHAGHDDRRRSLSPAASSSAHSLDNSPITPTQPHLFSLNLHQPQSVPVARRRRRRPSSVTSVVSAGSVTPVGDMAMGLIPSVGADRDFEGVGGWRNDRDGDDETWTTINSRLELPDRAHVRNHHRSPSGGPVTPGDAGVLMMKVRARSPGPGDARTPPSPNSSRARTPSASRMSVISMAASESYFSLAMSPTATKKSMTHPM